jgi:cell division protein FtsB
MTLVRRPILLVGPAAVLVLALALATNVLPLRQIIAQRQEITETQSRLDSLDASNAELERRAEALETPLEIERLAREELGYIRPGEEAFVVITPRADDAAPATVDMAAAEPLPADRAWYQRLWDYLTGRDLAG